MNNTALVTLNRNTISLTNLYLYSKLSNDVLQARLKYTNLVKSIQNICNLYSSEHVEVQDRIKTVRQAIRNATKGQAASYSIDAITDSLYLENVTEQLYVANQALLKSTYKKLAQLTHPDKQSTNINLFQAVNAAYRNKDLVYMQQLYITLVNNKNLYWVQGEGLIYCKQELHRPQVSLTLLAKSPLYAICRMHATGNSKACSKLVLQYLLIQEVNLIKEFDALKNQQFNQQEK